jgi:hypothetical protein
MTFEAVMWALLIMAGLIVPAARSTVAIAKTGGRKIK